MVNFAYGDKYAAFLHDAVILYAVALNETIAKGMDYRSGIVVASHMRNKLFTGSWSAETQCLQESSVISITVIIVVVVLAQCDRRFDRRRDTLHVIVVLNMPTHDATVAVTVGPTK